MKQQTFSFSIIFTLLFALIFTISCSNNTETATSTDDSETITASELASNEADTISEIDYTETTQEEETPAEQDNTETETVAKKDVSKPEKSTKTTKSTPRTTTTKTETAPKKEIVSTKKVETTPKQTTQTTKTKVETAPKKEVAAKKTVTTTPKKTEKPVKPFSHGAWDDLLRAHVSSTGKVNYAGFKKDKAKLDDYLNLLSANEPSGKSKNDQIAFWINAYNAFTVDLIVDNYPVSSILKLDNGKTWMVKRITIGGKKYSLEDIEKKVLIGKFKEPRIHFAINCAAKSCPPLKNRAWTGSGLNADLDRASRNFINNSAYNQIERKTANLSQIFNWYKGDFSDVNEFINTYADAQITSKTKVNYNEYNWDLNK